MTIKYEPSKLIRRTRLRQNVARLVNKNRTINRTALKSLTEFGVLPKKTLERIALKVIKEQKEVYQVQVSISDGLGKVSISADERREDVEKKPVSAAMLQARVQSAALHEQTRVIQRAYRGERYRWLKSTAKDPRPEHVKNYGKIFQLGVGDDNGDDPGDLFGCQCGMEILVDETQEEFNERLEDAI